VIDARSSQNALVLSALALMTVLPGAVGTPPDGTADVVYGQLGSFTSAILNSGGVSGGPTAESLWVPGGVALDRDGNLYVADTANNRVLFLPAAPPSRRACTARTAASPRTWRTSGQLPGAPPLPTGSTVLKASLKFEVFAGLIELTDTHIVHQLKASETSCTPGQSEDVELLAAGATVLHYDTTAGQFIYNWQTPRKPGLCHLVTVALTDGSTLTARFRLK
jgi:hypothetical protein